MLEKNKGKAPGEETPKAKSAKRGKRQQHNGSQGTAQEFLMQLRPGGPWLLVAIDPNSDSDKPTAITAQQQTEASSFIERWNGKRNCYYTVNPIRQPLNKKSLKTDITAIEYMLGDLDPAEDETPAAAKARYLAQLETMQPKPTAVIDSGNGLNVLWRLTERIVLAAPVPDAKGKLDFSSGDKTTIANVEARCKAMMQRLGSVSGTQNIDRILRLPATLNLPTKAKLAAGRVPAALLWFNSDATCTLDDFPLSDKKPKKKQQQKSDDGASDLHQSLRNMLHLQGAQPAGYPSRSELFFAFINAALRRGIDENVIVEASLDQAYAGNAIYEHVKDNGGENYVKRQIEKAANQEQTDDRGRVLIRWKQGETDLAWRATQKALQERGSPVYVRHNRLVEPLWRWEKAAGSDQRTLSARLEPFDLYRLTDIVAHRVARFQKWDGRKCIWKNIDPPKEVILQLLKAKYWPFPAVTGIINAPTMRPDGSLLTKEGYDEATQLWYKSSGEIVLPPIPEHPSKEQAQASLEKLRTLLKEFAFANEVDRTVALAAIMTTVLRGALPVVPLFLVTAPEPRSGKTYLVNVIAMVATGHIPPSTAGASEDRPDEIEKRVETAALAGRPIMHFNNLPNGMRLESARLSELVTEGWVLIRMLGEHKEAVCDCRATTVFLNGNNVRVVGDLVLRALHSRLDAKSEEPESQSYEFDPIAEIRKDRGGYLAAVFTIARAFKHANTTVEYKRVAGFEAWSSMVQQALIWLGMPDSCGSIEGMRAMDDSLDELANLVNALRNAFTNTNSKFTVAMCQKKADEQAQDNHERPYFKHSDLRELMLVHGKINNRAFGKLLGRHEDRYHAGWRYMAAGTVHGSMAYKLESPSGYTPPTTPTEKPM